MDAHVPTQAEMEARGFDRLCSVAELESFTDELLRRYPQLGSCERAEKVATTIIVGAHGDSYPGAFDALTDDPRGVEFVMAREAIAACWGRAQARAVIERASDPPIVGDESIH